MMRVEFVKTICGVSFSCVVFKGIIAYVKQSNMTSCCNIRAVTSWNDTKHYSPGAENAGGMTDSV